MKKYIFFLLLIYSFQVSFSQTYYEQHLDRLKGGGSGLYNAFTLNYELGFVKLDSTQFIYSKTNKKKKQENLIISYKNIKAIKRQNYLLIIPMKLVIKTKDGINYYFSSFRRKKLINFVRSKIEVDN